MQNAQKTPLKILLFGSTGQVGRELCSLLKGQCELHAFSHIEADFLLPKTLETIVAQYQPHFIINAAAYTAVDQAEREPELAFKVNAIAPQILAQMALEYRAWLIHYSTDYVFDGKKVDAYLETDLPHPINEYGKSKLKGEQAIQSSQCKHIILRTSWIYSIHGQNFLKTIAKRAQALAQLVIINDQHGTPTGAHLIATCTWEIIQQLQSILGDQANKLSGLYHLTASGATHWYDYARQILNELAKLHPEQRLAQLIPISAKEYLTLAQRPYNSRLSTEKIRKTFGCVLPAWQEEVRVCVHQLYP